MVKKDGWLDTIGKLLIFGFAMWWIFSSFLAVAAFFIVASFG